MTLQLTSSDILSAWEVGAGLSPLDRAITILWAAGVSGDIAALPLAERDRTLLHIRAATLGPTLSACATCPDCSEDLEMNLELETLSRALPTTAEEQVQIGNTQITIRSLTSRDIASVTKASPTDIPELLRDRLTNAKDLAATECAELDRHIESREEKVELSARVNCSACSASWKEVLDIAALFWVEIEAKALRLLSEITEIAAALGWSERDILSLSEPRRHVYLSLARQQ